MGLVEKPTIIPFAETGPQETVILQRAFVGAAVHIVVVAVNREIVQKDSLPPMGLVEQRSETVFVVLGWRDLVSHPPDSAAMILLIAAQVVNLAARQLTGHAAWTLA